MQDLMFAEEPVEKREQLLRDNCDQIVERSYTRKFEQHEVNARREELENVSIQVSELEDKLAEIRADYKGRIKPLLERRGLILDELKARDKDFNNFIVGKHRRLPIPRDEVENSTVGGVAHLTQNPNY